MSVSPRKTPEQLRSYRWYGRDELRSFGHRSRAKQAGWGADDYVGKPIIGILNTWSDLNSCHMHLRLTADAVKRGILQAGGHPMEVPVMSVGEMLTKPTAMFHRNFLAMETEEVLRAHPLDGAVLLGGCDKSTPGLLMGAFSANIPVIYMPCGPMMKGNYRGTTLGSGTDVWKYWDEKRAGNLGWEEWCEIEDGIARSPGHCMTMGTASTMTALAEALGLVLPGASSIPAVDSAHTRMAAAAGRQILENVWLDRTPASLVDKRSFENAIITDMALGGSTNAIVHLVAMAGRLGIPLPLEDFDAISRRTPLLANIRPAGKYLMEEFYQAGGLSALLHTLRDLLHTDALTVTGKTLGENIEGCAAFDTDVIRPLDNPLQKEGGTAILRGNLCPDGAVIKHAAATPALCQHTGPALVFDSYPEMKKAIEDPDLDVTADTVLILRNAGPVGAPGMPEWGQLPIPKKLIDQGVRDMVRLSDCRMSGTSYGACALHLAPESAIGGPLALVENGDLIELDVANRRLHLHVSEEELDRRRAAWSPAPIRYHRGYPKLYVEHVTQANEGADFDFLQYGPALPEPEIF
ncbi:MAG: dihydroxy-acid dehydratase [Verrucomicrobiales bacterium]|nr:dihydroxy-acid dehydratase [Verrucomicrobiales bacterium]